MRLPRWLTTVPALVLVAALYTACGSAATNSGDPAQAPNGEPKAGGTATFVLSAEPASLDPAVLGNSYGTNAVTGNALYGQLLKSDPVTGEFLPAMAESLETTDGTIWTLKLRSGLTFTDGTPLDAEAVRFNWERMKDPKVAASTNLAQVFKIATLKAVDPQTLEIALVSPSAQFASVIASSGMNFIASPTALKKGPEAFTAAPVGAGPFVYEEWVRQGNLTLKKNADYWDEGKPYLDELVLRTDADSQRRLTALQSDEAELVMGGSPEHENLAAESGKVVTKQPLSGSVMLLLNAAKPPFDDPRAREAMVLAVDRETINDTVYGGSAEVPKTVMVEDSPFYESDVTFPDADRKRAKQLFDELEADGKPVAMNIVVTPGTEGAKAGQSIQAQLAEFKNVTVKVKTVDLAAFHTTLTGGDFSATLYGLTMVDPIPAMNSLFNSKSPANFGHFNDPELDKALGAGEVTLDQAVREKAYRTAQERIVALNPFIAYARQAGTVLSSPNVGGIEFYGLGSPQVDTLWLNAS